MNGRILLWVLVALVLVAVIGGIGVSAYNWGVSQGLAESGKLVAPAPGVMPYPYVGPFFWRPFGFGFFGLLGPLFLFFLFFGLVRVLIWRGPRRWYGHGGDWNREMPSPFEEWHRKAHERSGDKPTS